MNGVISSIAEYKFKKIDIFIDTNIDNFPLAKLDNKLPGHIDLNIITHSNLEHPFLLTWQHRKNILANKDNYEYFMYLEDDISVSSYALEKWRQDSQVLFKYNKLRGFIRCELNNTNEIVSTDYLRRIRCNETRCFGGRSYFKPKNPYQGFWLYSKAQLDKFVNSKCWLDGNCNWEVRERASAGMIWHDKDEHNIVVPLERLSIPDYVLVRHLPNNYALDKSDQHGSLKISDLIPKIFYQRLCIKLIQKICSLIK